MLSPGFHQAQMLHLAMFANFPKTWIQSKKRPKAIYLRVKVSQDPGEDGVLHQVIVGSAGQCVQVH